MIAAIAIAEYVGGTTDHFVEMMNQRAGQIGAVHTSFRNPNGLQDENHYTTAKDMALIAREAMKSEVFRAVAKAKSWEADRGGAKYSMFYNKNKVVYQYAGGTGIKIGYTKTAGRTLVASSQRNGMEVICVVMNDPDWFQDAYHLMDYVYDQYEMVKVATAERLINAVVIHGGDKGFSYVGLKKDVFVPVLKGEKSKVSVMYHLPQSEAAPVSRWEEAAN